MGKLFGTDGIRGKANVWPMSPDLVLRLGQAIGIYFRKHHPHHPRILIGKDTRRSGYMLEQALCSGICSVGVDAFFLGPLPTPGIAYLTRGMRACAGIVISASHNPYWDNGIKIFSADGYKLPDSVEDELERMLDSDLTLQLKVDEDIGTARRIEDAIGQYAVFLKEQFPKHLTLEGLRIVIDCANGAAYRVAPKVFAELGAEIFVIGDEPNGTNINEMCGALHPQTLRERVLLYKADIGIAVDGDADRLVIVDDRGEQLDGDEILAICGIHLLKQNRLSNNALVSTIMSNMGLDVALSRHGGSVVRTKVGDRYVMEAMKEGNYNLGGEQSGHLIFRDSATTGDGILAALHVLRIMVEQGKKISELKTCMERLPQVLKSIEVPEKVPLEKMPAVSGLISTMEKKLGKEGRVVFRYSGTESVVRIMIEGANKDEIERMAQELSHRTTQSINEHRAAKS